MNTGDVTIRDMAYDHSAQKMYAIGTGAASGKFLYTVDISTGAGHGNCTNCVRQ